MAIELGTNRVTVELDDVLYASLIREVEARSSNIRKASVTEVVRSLIAEHLADARIPSAP